MFRLILVLVSLILFVGCSEPEETEFSLGKTPVIEPSANQCTQLDTFDSQIHPLFVCYQDDRVLLCDKNRCMNLSVSNACY